MMTSSLVPTTSSRRQQTDEPLTWDDAYTRHVTLVLSSILFERKDFCHVFSTEEVALATRFLGDFQPLEQQLYARLLQRQGGWIKTTSLFRYFIPYNEIEFKRDELLDKTQSGREQLVQSVNNTDVQRVVRVMLDAGFVEAFPVTSTASRLPHMATVADHDRFNNDKLKQEQERATLDTVLTAVARCASTLELSILFKKMTGSKKHGTKVDLMAAVRNVAKTQKRINGSRLPVAQFMQQYLARVVPSRGKTIG
uniref:Uncharacterized protein n=1 Tax=Peronospora matthiolae TaxID=2874970 RepID=A0AAV1U960_9STRA